jgi:ABC-type antimicrobial peptide transport system ATPase subunit
VDCRIGPRCPWALRSALGQPADRGR